MNTIILIILAVVIALVLLKITRKLIHTAFFIALVGIVFFLLKHFIAVKG